MKTKCFTVLVGLLVVTVLGTLVNCAGPAPAPSPSPKPPPTPSLPVKPPPTPPTSPKASPAPAASPKPAPAASPSPKPAPSPSLSPQPGPVKVKWLGQSAFLITSSKGIKIITDPYATSARLSYGEIKESADVVTVSHEHSDHNNVSAVSGSPQVLRGNGEAKGIMFKAIATYHDASQGKERGNNTVFTFEVDGLKFCHLGDLGHLLNDDQATQIGKVDILLIPVGGNYTIDAAAATQVVDRLKPGAVIPMHYQTEKTSLPVSGVDDFLRGKQNVIRQDSSEVEFRAVPTGSRIIVLKPAN